MSVEIVDRRELKRRMEEILSKDSSYISLDGVNPNHIRLAGLERYIYVKNISPAQLSNDNPNIVRVQLPIRNTFDTIKNSDVSFILLGYDAQNDVCAVWNPHEVKQRLKRWQKRFLLLPPGHSAASQAREYTDSEASQQPGRSPCISKRRPFGYTSENRCTVYR